MTASELALVLLSAGLHAVWSVSIKGSRDPLGFNVLQLAPTLACACALPWLFPLREVPGAVWALVAATGIAHGLYFYWLSRALATGALSVVYPIARSAPAFVPLVAIPWMGETLSWAGAAGIAVTMAGMWAVQAGEGLRWRSFATPGVPFAMLTLAASVAYSLIDKASMTRLAALDGRGHVPPAVAYYFLLGASAALVFVPLAARRLSRASLAALARVEMRQAVAASAISFASYVLILHALRTAPVSYVVTARQTSVLFATLLSTFWLHERPTRLRVLGALATVVGVALVAR